MKVKSVVLLDPATTFANLTPPPCLIGMRDFAQKMPQPRMPNNDAWPSVTVPMLVLLAGRSIVHDPRKAARAAWAVPGAQVEVWPAASHAINGEYPVEIADRVGDFTASLV